MGPTRILPLLTAAALLAACASGAPGAGSVDTSGPPASRPDTSIAFWDAGGGPHGAHDVRPSDLARTDLATPPTDALVPSDTASSDVVPELPDAGPPCVDLDGDGFGDGCAAGPDCDDADRAVHAACNCDEEPLGVGCPCDVNFPEIECFEASPALLGVGECRAGVRRCTAAGWTACDGQRIPRDERCDELDNDCDGTTDEAVLSACGDCNAYCEVDRVGESGRPFDITLANAGNVRADDQGNVVLVGGQTTETFIWIANSGEGTVSKLDTRTGSELARYVVCSDPSRTSVDLVGDVWVGCRGDGGVAKIALDLADCTDRDGDGTVETSMDRNGDFRITPDEMLPEGADECVRFVVRPDGTGAAPRALSVDKDNFCWVGFYGTGRFMRLHPDDGSVVAQVDTTGAPYGGVIDGDGILWVSFRNQGQLGRIDPSDPGHVQYLQPPGCVDLYGIAVDRHGRVWLANASCQDVLYYEPWSGTWGHLPIEAHGNTRGVAASLAGRVCFAHHTWTCLEGHYVTCVDDETLTWRALPLGGMKGPVGVAFDHEENLWAVNQCSSSATKLDPVTGTVIGEYPVGLQPYTYSDMTGYALHAFTAPEGWVDLDFEDLDAKLHQWVALEVVATTPADTAIYVQLRSSWLPEGLALEPWSPRFGPYPPERFPLDLRAPNAYPYAQGSYLQVRIILTTSDSTASPKLHAVEVRYE